MKLLNLNLDFRFAKRYFLPDLSLKKRLQILKTKIKEFQPEIITFQEVTDVLILAQLKRLFKDYGFVWLGFLKVAGGVVTLYQKEKWRLVSKEFTAFSEQGKFFSRQLADRILKKGILAVVLESKRTNQKFLVVNVHLTANYGQKLKEEEREILKLQLQEIEKIIKKRKFKKEIIAGDFNADFNNQVIQEWLKKIGFETAFSTKNCSVCPTQNPLCHRDQEKDFPIDNVLSQGFKKTAGHLVFNQEGEFVSDHYGQLVSFSKD